MRRVFYWPKEMNDLNPDTRSDLLELLNEHTMADDLAQAVLLYGSYCREGDSDEEAIRKTLEAVG